MALVTQYSVVIIDDEEDFATTLAERLSLRNMDVQVACSGRAGLEILQQGLPDVVLLDIRMPGLSGIEVLKSIRQFYKDLPVVIMTGHCSPEDFTRAQELGVSGYHAKPLDFNEFLSQIQGVLEQI